MTSSVIEVNRASEAQYALLSDYLVKHIVETPAVSVSTQRERLQHVHRASHVLNKIVDTASSLSDAYQDANGERQAEIATLSSNALTEFYTRLAKLKDWHRRHAAPPRAAEDAPEASVAAVDWTELEGGELLDGRDFLDRMFSGEEHLGRYLDLHAQHALYTNLPGSSKTSYLKFLDDFDRFEIIAKPRKLAGDKYRQYLDSTLDYLLDFTRRTFPMFDLEDSQTHAARFFEKKWAQGNVREWQSKDQATQLSEQGIWCEACQKMYSKQTVYNAHLSSKKHLKAAESASTSSKPPPQPNGHTSTSSKSSSTAKDTKEHRLAFLEDQISSLLGTIDSPLVAVRAETKSNIERRAALTDRERAQEIEDMEAREAEEVAKNAEAARKGGAIKRKDPQALKDDDEEERIYNPLKLPLGWDGKPIPYVCPYSPFFFSNYGLKEVTQWLYKLHGLGVEYSCEICSGASYAGRKNFERHFQEARHTFGMKALGLPNTKHFHEITKIEDAIALAEKLKAEGKQEIFRAEETEELEDEEGNVYSKKVYNDLKTEGLL